MNKKYININKYFVIGCVLSFVLPLIGTFAGFAIKDISPFGERTLCSMDGFSQYYPMLENMADAIKDGELFYSFNGALGFNLWAQSAYYTNSPLWLIVYFLPHSAQLVAINLLVALRFALTSLFFYIRLFMNHKNADEKHLVMSFPAISLCFGLSGYTLAFCNQLMWADVVMLLPLVILGVERMHQGKSPTLYVAALFLSMWSCFYLSFMVCIFLCLYFLFLSLKDWAGLKTSLKRALKFALFSILSACLAAVVLVPVYKALSLTLASELGFEGHLYFKYTLADMLKRLLFFQKPSLEYDAPNLYMGVTCVLILLSGAFVKGIRWEKKILAGSFIAFMFMTMSLNLGEYVWHGFHYPNQLPGRQSFLFIFLCLSFAAEIIIRAPLKRYLVAAISFVICLEITLNAACQLGYNVWASKASSIRQYDKTVSVFSVLDKTDDFVRVEWADVKKNNYPQQYSYKGVTYYSSTMTADAYNFFQQMGLPRYAKNVSVYYGQSAITNSLFGLQYIMQSDGEKIIHNIYALPLGFVADEAVYDFDLYSQAAGDETQKALWLSLTGEDKMSFVNQAKALQAAGMTVTEFDTDVIKGKITADSDGVLFLTIPDDGGWKLYIDGEEREIVKAASYFCSAPITKGSHEIKMVYTVPGIVFGGAVSGASVLGIVLYAIVINIKRRHSSDESNVETHHNRETE